METQEQTIIYDRGEAKQALIDRMRYIEDKFMQAPDLLFHKGSFIIKEVRRLFKNEKFVQAGYLLASLIVTHGKHYEEMCTDKSNVEEILRTLYENMGWFYFHDHCQAKGKSLDGYVSRIGKEAIKRAIAFKGGKTVH